MPAPCTGHVWDDRDADGLLGPGDVPLAGLRVRISEAVFLIGYDQSAVTDASGFYSIDSTGLGATTYHIRVYISDEWSPIFGNDFDYNTGPGQVDDFPFIELCTRVQSSWLVKVCFIPARGVRVTFKNRHGRLFTCLYPGTTLADYVQLREAASKGRWIHWFYAKVRPYVAWPVSP